eukprot:9070938-Lingulodinium_polyedra.AAC.1
MNQGYSFVWVKNKLPCFVRPAEGVAVMTVANCCPYYNKDTMTYDYGDERLQELCGIRVKLGPDGAPACPLIT